LSDVCIQSALAPDAFGAAQATEANREAPDGAPIIAGGPADSSLLLHLLITKKSPMSKLAMLGVAAAGAAAGLVAAVCRILRL
jgi:hypothetical protein